MDKNNTLIIIPLRANSQRLPNKNLLNLQHIPLFMHSVNYAKQQGFTNIVISTDGEEIKKIALENHINVIDRPIELAQDNTPTIAVLKHAINNLSQVYDTVILLQATNPLRPKNLLKNAFKKFSEGNYQSLITITENTKKLGEISNNTFKPTSYKFGERSQDLKPLFYENGLIYITKSSLIKQGVLVSDTNCAYVVNHPYATVDIDTEFDLNYAKFILENYPNE